MTISRPDKGTSPAALIPRTAALLILLYQLRLLAGDLADTPVFIAALAGALVSAIFLARKKINGQLVKPYQAIIILALIPWAIRFFIALPRLFMPGVSGGAIVLDSLLLNLDRNNFSALLPFYWMAITSYFSMKSRIFLRADIIAADTFFLVLFSIVSASSMEAYRWPVLMIALFALVLFLQILSLVFSLPPELKLRRKESILSGAFLFLLIFLGAALFIRPFQERAVERGGGLLEPKLFRFDFSQILRLESEISVNDDLVLIVRKDPDDYHNLLRRYTLSGYGPKQGFFRVEEIDEAAHPKSLPGRHTLLPVKEINSHRISDQEYYLVNFDASAFIGMNMPVEVTPFETWDASSFNSAYAVRSYTSEALPFELIDAVHGESENFGLSAEEYALYTEYGGDEAIASFAREIIRQSYPFLPETAETAGSNSFSRIRNSLSHWEQTELIYNRLKYSEYRYSLKPGIAPDGDQLKYFLFETKKGYCSYYAFAFTLLLRSLGIPCRVAAGFFVDPSTEAFNYFPVRTDMAHAWVEVWFPGYGWIEYDPTSESMAEGEEFRFSQGTPPELFERLMKEILENRSRLKAKEEEETGQGRLNFENLGKRTLEFISKQGPLVGATALIILFLAMRSGFLWLSWLHKNPRKKALYLWAHTKRRLALAGIKRSHTIGEAEWAKANGRSFGALYSLYQDSAAARFAPVYTVEDKRIMEEHYLLFKEEYRKALPSGRRLLAWVLPPLALIAGSRARTSGTIVILIIFLFLLRLDSGAQDNTLNGLTSGGLTSEQLYENALTAQWAENWELAITLYSAGAKLDPNDFRFPWSLGNLYFNRSLYRLAWEEYRRAERINPWIPELLFRLAYTAGYLNRNEDSADYLEKILLLDPDNMEAIGTLGWMYFKLHRLPEGERLLLDAMNRMGEDSDSAMTLGFIYSDLFQYDNAKSYYLKAIEGAQAIGDRVSIALVYYNLSILESRFYRFSLAYDSTNASLEAMNRASGRLARGELYLRRMELSRSLEEYQEAYGTDSSPLSKLNLAQVYQTGGRLTEAMLYARDCLKAGDHSWMLNYGIDPVRYKRDIHEVLKNTYEGLLKAEAFSRPNLFFSGTPKESVQSIFRSVSYRFRRSVHEHLFRKYSLLAADAYSGSGGTEIHLDALIQYYNAFEVYPRRAMDYLRQARNFEEPIIPGSAPSYNFEEGRLLSNKKTLTGTLMEFDPLWEQDMIAEVYAELTRKGNRAERQDAAERLFAINRGALPQNGTRLPVVVEIEDSVDHVRGVLRGAVKAVGLETARGTSPRYTLRFARGGEGLVSCTLYDGGRGITVWKQNLPLPPVDHDPVTRGQKAAFAKSIRDGIFNGF